MDLESRPIKTLDELLQWSPETATGRPSDVELSERNAWTESRNTPRTLLCHDMRGGYSADRFTNGCQVAGDEPYLFYHWSHIHGFIYFSHNFVTIPPTGWITAAHRNGVPIFGTLITEWDDGKAIWDRLTTDPALMKEVALLLVSLAEHYGFDGWLINIENSIEPEHVDKVLMFLHWLREGSTLKMVTGKKRKPLTIIWYDSITIKGDLKWQNTLNGHNMKFFQFVDGIFLNYGWKFCDLDTAKNTAGTFRKYDVFVGVDVFGRGCFGGGGWDTDKALEIIRQNDMSVAMFAPGWVLECNDSCSFLPNQNKFWSSISPFLPKHKICSLPFSTNFCVGYGGRKFTCGAGIDLPLERKEWTPLDHWYDLNQHALQPSWSEADCEGKTMRLCHDDGWNGGGCLELVSTETTSDAVWTLFQTDIAIPSAVSVEVTAKIMSSSSECDVILSVRDDHSQRDIRLVCQGQSREGSASSQVWPSQIVISDPDKDGWPWKTFRFEVVDDLIAGCVLEGVSFRVGGGNGRSGAWVRTLLGAFGMGLKTIQPVVVPSITEPPGFLA